MPNFELPYDQISFDLDSQDKFIRDSGVKFVHYKSIICPLGVDSVTDTRSTHHDHSQCQNGFLYELAGEVTAAFTNNSAVASLDEAGLLDGSIVNVTFPRLYDDSKEHVYVQTYDRFYLPEFELLVPTTQRVEAHATGLDKLTYLAQRVEYIQDENGIKYGEGDFIIDNGMIRWVGNRPGYNSRLSRGTIYAIRYLYTPFFYVTRLMHEIRIANKQDFKTNSRIHQRAPYSALLNREFYMYKKEPDDQGDNRFASIGPKSGSFGAR